MKVRRVHVSFAKDLVAAKVKYLMKRGMSRDEAEKQAWAGMASARSRAAQKTHGIRRLQRAFEEEDVVEGESGGELA